MSADQAVVAPPPPATAAWMSDPRRHCDGVPTSVFFVDIGSTSQAAAAKAICEGCPFMVPCRQYALDDSSISGVWGGWTGKDRRDFRRGIALRTTVRRSIDGPRRRPGPTPTQPCGTAAAYARHLRRREKPCEECREAHRIYHKQRNR